MDLLETLESEGYGKDYISTSVKKDIVDSCTHENSPKAKAWRKIVTEEVEDALVEKYPPIEEIKKYDREKSKLRKADKTFDEIGTAQEVAHEELLDLKKLREQRKHIQANVLEEEALLAELGIKKDGRRE